MNWRSIPYSIIGLLIITVGLIAVIVFHNQQLIASSYAMTPALITQTEVAPVPVLDELQPPILDEADALRKRPAVNPSSTVQPQVAAFGLGKAKPVAARAEYTCGLTAQEADRYAFEVVNPQVAYQISPGKAFNVPVYIRNTGTSVWCGENTINAGMYDTNAYKLRLGTAKPQDHRSDVLGGDAYRVNMSTPLGMILPGETALFNINGTAPAESGVYREFYAPVVEQLSWFPGVEIQLDLYVGDYSINDLEELYYLRTSGSTKDIDSSQTLQVVIETNTQKEFVYLGKNLIHEYQVSSGAWKTPTPVGDYTIYNKQELRIGGKSPHYRMPNWIGLRHSDGSFRGYGMHALPWLGRSKESSGFWKEAVGHLGVPVSHGCIRRSDSDAEWLFSIANPETTKIKVVRSFDRQGFEAALKAS